MKSKEELAQLKQEFQELEEKLSQLSENEIKLVVGGSQYDNMFQKEEGPGKYNFEIYDIESDIEKKKQEFLNK